MTSKEWVKNELSLSDDCLTTTDRVMFDKILQDLERLEAIDNANPSKALEVLGYIGGYIIPTNNGNQHLKDFCDREFAILKQALTELKQIKEAESSEVLIFIQELLNISETEKHFINLANYDTRLNLIKTKQALLKAQEQEKN